MYDKRQAERIRVEKTKEEIVDEYIKSGSWKSCVRMLMRNRGMDFDKAHRLTITILKEAGTKYPQE